MEVAATKIHFKIIFPIKTLVVVGNFFYFIDQTKTLIRQWSTKGNNEFAIIGLVKQVAFDIVRNLDDSIIKTVSVQISNKH